jgi:branched-chain amino acid transport system substrate-binding protein
MFRAGDLDVRRKVDDMRMFRWMTTVILAVIACWSASSPAAPPDPVRIGVLLAESGRAGAYGRMQRRAVEVARRMRPRVLGRPVKLFFQDSESDPATAGQEAARLIAKRRVAAIIGPTTSAAAGAVGHIVDRKRVPVISPTATAAGPIGRYVFRVCFSDEFQGRAAARYALYYLGARRAAIIVDLNQPYALTLARAFAREFSEWRARVVFLSIFRGVGLRWARGEIVGRAYFQTGDKDFISQIRAVAWTNPQVVYLPNYADENALIAIQIRRTRIRGRPFWTTLLAGDSSQSSFLLAKAGRALQDIRVSRHARAMIPGFLLTSHFFAGAPQTPLARAFVAAFRKDTGRNPSAIEALAADAYFLAMDAMERAGSLSGPRLRRALAATSDFEGVTGRITMTPRGVPEKNVVILRVFKDKFVRKATLRP